MSRRVAMQNAFMTHCLAPTAGAIILVLEECLEKRYLNFGMTPWPNAHLFRLTLRM
eukprot:m.54502 g.54502  ORF g.54502 m.54502 type:complete len:56 (+) comp10931_c1_seq3:2077-2244(+)